MSIAREYMGEEMAFRWFGQAWDAPVCETTPHEVTPVGVDCERCHVDIAPGDRGFMVPRSVFATPEIGPDQWGVVFATYHRDCFVAVIEGAIRDPEARP